MRQKIWTPYWISKTRVFVVVVVFTWAQKHTHIVNIRSFL